MVLRVDDGMYFRQNVTERNSILAGDSKRKCVRQRGRKETKWEFQSVNVKSLSVGVRSKRFLMGEG